MVGFKKWRIRVGEAGQVERKFPGWKRALRDFVWARAEQGARHPSPSQDGAKQNLEVTCYRKQFSVTQRGSITEAFPVASNSVTDTIRIAIQLIPRAVESVWGKLPGAAKTFQRSNHGM